MITTLSITGNISSILGFAFAIFVFTYQIKKKK